MKRQKTIQSKNFINKKKVFSKEDIIDAWELIQKSSKIILLTHKKPDGDGIGACIALELILTRLGKTVEIVYPNRPEFEYKRQPQKVLIGEHILSPDLIISCDTANYKQLYYPKDFELVPLINIDHHISNSIRGRFNFVYGKSSSSCEVLFLLLQEWDSSLIDKFVAEGLLFGILYDSQVFHISSTSSTTLRIAADLIDKGADLFELKQELLSNKNIGIIKLWAMLLNRIEIFKSKKMVMTYITQSDLKEFGLTLSSLIGFNNFLAQISDVDVTLLFYETEDGKTKVSLRSKKYDVNKLAAQFGGGGHKHAAGILSDMPLEELMKAVVGKV